MRKGLVQPLFQVEVEPGLAAQLALDWIHPFTMEPEIPETLLNNIMQVAHEGPQVAARRMVDIAFWEARSRSLFQDSDQQLRHVKDPHLRRLLRGCSDDQGIKVGTSFHVALWQEMASQVNSPDQQLISQLMQGRPVVGPILRSNTWPALPYSANSSKRSETVLNDRAWELRKKIITQIRSRPRYPVS